MYLIVHKLTRYCLVTVVFWNTHITSNIFDFNRIKNKSIIIVKHIYDKLIVIGSY